MVRASHDHQDALVRLVIFKHYFKASEHVRIAVYELVGP